MRHLGSFLLALILTPAIYLLTGVGLDAFAVASENGLQEDPGEAVLTLCAFAGAAGGYAVLIMARLSPVGPVLAGLSLLAVSVWPLTDRKGYQGALADLTGLISDTVEIRGLSLVGQTGLGVFLAIPLLATVASPRRWSRFSSAIAQVEPAAIADAASYLPAAPTEPATQALPDIKAPSLGYPKAVTPVEVQPPPVARPPVLGGDPTISLIEGDDPDKTRKL